jgi:polyisoprenyl-phosphate glycosyltransferase
MWEMSMAAARPHDLVAELLAPSPSLISVVLPAHNEENTLRVTAHAIGSALEGCRLEIIIIDDGSTDQTWRVIEELIANHPVRGIQFTRNFGHQSAILAGLIAARGDTVVTMDADGQHPAELLPIFLEHWKKGYQVVQGVRTRNATGSWYKRWTSTLFYRVMRSLAGVDIHSGSADFRLLDRLVVKQVLASSGPLLFMRGLIPWLGYRTSYIPFEAGPRIAGETSYTFRRMLRLSLDGLLSFSIIPLRLAIALGFVISGASFLYLAYILVIRLSAGNVVPGWASMTGLLSLLGGIQLLTLGVLGEYVGRIFMATLHRPRFVISKESESD